MQVHRSLVCQAAIRMAPFPDIDHTSDKMRVELRLQLPEMLQERPPLTTRLLLGLGKVIIHPEPLLPELTPRLENSTLSICRIKCDPDRP